MIRAWRLVAGVGGFLSVAAGAAAAHLTEPHTAELLRTGALYGMVHATALLAVAATAARPWALAVAGWCFAAGIILFSFSLFALALTHIAAFGLVTPVGGVLLMLGWAALALAALVRS
jgi:uncharacterized membrane protein YgdD (TMEM256/DUF423 family)